MSAASLDTSDPEIFIAIPRSACISLVLVPRKASEKKANLLQRRRVIYTIASTINKKISLA